MSVRDRFRRNLSTIGAALGTGIVFITVLSIPLSPAQGSALSAAEDCLLVVRDRDRWLIASRERRAAGFAGG